MSRLAQAVLEPLPPGGSRLLAMTDANGKLCPEFVYLFRTPDGSESIAIGPAPMEKLAELSATVEPVDSKMAAHMRHLLATWRAEQAGLGGTT